MTGNQTDYITPMPLYKVMGYTDGNDKPAWTAYAFAHSRKDAYFEVRGTKQHNRWDADRVADSVKIDSQKVLRMRAKKLLMRCAFDFIPISHQVDASRKALFDNRVMVVCTTDDRRLSVELDDHLITVKDSTIDGNLPISEYLIQLLQSNNLIQFINSKEQ